jgi:hypothetical protein
MSRVASAPPRSGFIEPCLPSAAERLPSGPDWVHEIKQRGHSTAAAEMIQRTLHQSLRAFEQRRQQVWKPN